MNAKEFLELNKQMMAFNTIMKGELKAETDAAQAALDALGGAQEISNAKAALEKEKSMFEEYQTNVMNQIDFANTKLNSDSQALEVIKAKLDSDRIELRNAQEALAAQQDSLKVERSRFEIQSNAALAEISAQRQEIANQQSKLQSALQAVAEREKIVQDKLAQMKAIV